MMEAVVMERVRELLKWRQWYRTNLWADWLDLRKENEVELRALLKLARQARRIERGRPDPMDRFKSYQDWSESEKAAAWGR